MMDWDEILTYTLAGIGLIGAIIGLFFIYLGACVLLGLCVEAIMGWMGKDMADWYWTGVGLVALLGAVISVKKSDD